MNSRPVGGRILEALRHFTDVNMSTTSNLVYILLLQACIILVLLKLYI
jgi:hypothetical protein